MDNLQDRQDIPIWNAIEAKNFKQALKLVDKRLSKKATDYLEALKIYIRSLLPQASEKSAVLLHLEELVNKRPGFLDLAVIELYENALEEVLPGSRESWINTIGELRWQCVKANPKHEDTSLIGLQACLSRDDLDHARQIANSLEKNFPRNHSYIFWNITSMFLFATSQQCPENQKRIWGGLASGQISKLAAATRQASDLKELPIKSIHTPQELLLLDRITESFGKPDQRLEYLQEPNLGPESIVAKGEWGLWILKLRLMEEACQWAELFDLCKTLLRRARTTNEFDQYVESSFSDWTVWEAYFFSASKLEGQKYYDQIRSEVEWHLDPACKIDKSWKRNACLARVKLTFECSKAFSQDHVTEYGDANTAYNDLRQFVEALEPNERARLLSMLDQNTGLEKSQQKIGPSSPHTNNAQKLSTASQITRAINRLKLKYLVMCSIPEHERTQRPASNNVFKCSSCTDSCGVFCARCLAMIAEESIRSYQTAINDDGQITKSLLTTDRHPADDLCILAAMCLIKLGLVGSSSGSESLNGLGTTYLLQATALLESAWTRSKSNFQLSLLLVRLNSYLGAGSLAMRVYQRLFLKQVQLDTLSYSAFDRISTLHPHPISDSPEGPSNNRTLLEQLQKLQKLYKTSREHITRNTWLSFKHGSYNSIFEFREVAQKLSRSLSAVMSVVESNKIYRFTTNTVPAEAITQMLYLIPAEFENMENPLSDNNDYETFPNFESSRATPFEELSRFIPGPTEHRYRMNLLAEKVMLIVDPSSELSDEKDTLQQSLKQYLDSRRHLQNLTSKLGFESLTRSEQLAGHAYHAMALIITESCDQALWAEGDCKTRLENHDEELCDRLEEQADLIEQMQALVPAFQQTLNALYTAYEVGRTTVYFCRHLSGKGKAVHETQIEASKKITKTAERLIQVVINKCVLIKNGLDEGGWIDRVLQSALPDTPEKFEQDEHPSASLVEAVKQIIDEVFMEGWAGELVESWKDSIAGFSYIKMPAK
ncbi:hypothetical protein EG329_001570 [Mollisiaceae sp. DMI_Dod_QoI]|nr:hypothetical protein EG329_001570 [Helotiales sp. DMI_Dod_QoI]